MRQLKFCVVATFLTLGLCLGVGCKGLWNNDDDVSTSTSGTSSNSSSDSSSDSSTDANAYSTEQDSDYDFSTNTDSITYIHCLGSSFNIEGRVDAVDVKSSNLKCEILYGGTYYIDGTLNDGQIQVEADTSEIVKILLNGVTISGSTYQAQAPLRIKSCKKAILMIADGTTNTITEMLGNEDSACVFSKADLYICDQGASTGTLTVESVVADGIASKDGLIIKSGNITVNAVDDGIRGKDYLIIHDGNITVNAVGDGLKSTNENVGCGYILINGGNFSITSADEGIQAESTLTIEDGTFVINESEKCIAALGDITINGGDFILSPTTTSYGESGSGHGITTTKNSSDVRVGNVTINGGKINITKSYEGIQGVVITVNGGEIWVKSSDDAFNASDGSSTMGGGFGGMGGNPWQTNTSTSTSSTIQLIVNDGFIYAVSTGDGLDSNGEMIFNGGVVLVSQNSENNEPLDAGDAYSPTIKGGVVVAVGSQGMASAPTVSQTAFFVSASGSANSYFAVNDASGNNILAWKVPQAYQVATVSTSDMGTGTYTYITNATVSGSEYIVGSGFYYPAASSNGTGTTITTTKGSCTSTGGGSSNFGPGGR